MTDFLITCGKCNYEFGGSYDTVGATFDQTYDEIAFIDCPNCKHRKLYLPESKINDTEIKMNDINKRAYCDVLTRVGPSRPNSEYYMKCYRFWDDIGSQK